MPEVRDWVRGLALVLSRGCRAVEAGGDAYAIVGRRRGTEGASTADDGSSSGVEVSLARHSAGVRDLAEQFARAAGVPADRVPDLALAGWLHDVGKADPRFQVWLHGGNEMAAALADSPLAKSARGFRNRSALRRARERAGYPEGGRHEVESLALIAPHEQLQRQAHDWDLVQHLVVSHHGFGRPFVPAIVDPQPASTILNHGGQRLAHDGSGPVPPLGDACTVAERYWRLVRRYGWWGLAWFEAILRLADHRTSERESAEEGGHGV
ncbi:MAG: CRISPR-associated endonuclease Cas3'' [Candidatus Latescibacterota bacterium]